MYMVDLIQKKRHGETLTTGEIDWFIQGCTRGEIPDYQISALLMAICIQGMDLQETTDLTLAMARSGEQMDLSFLPGVKGDKHSTGGVGDKTTLVVAPLAAACGLVMAKMSGRGLGHTGGTVDKLESIPGFSTHLSPEDFARVLRQTGLCLAGHTGNLAPADQRLYTLRDVTGTVDSIPLIASSILSKKLAAGADCILLDVKVGSGALLPQREQSVALARTMVEIGTRCGRKVTALLTNMDVPLGNTVGNALEVKEAIDTLKGQGPEDLTELSLALTADLLVLGGFGTLPACRERARAALEDGSALEKFRQVIQAQGGNPKVVEDPSLLPRAPHMQVVLSPQTGYLTQMDTHGCGNVCMHLGAGRQQKDETIDPTAGMVLHAKTGAFVHQGQPLATLYTSDPSRFAPAREELLEALTFGEASPSTEPLIYDRITPGSL